MSGEHLRSRGKGPPVRRIRGAAAIAAVVTLVAAPFAYAAATPPTDEDAAAAVAVLDSYVRARPTTTVTTTVTAPPVTVTPSPGTVTTTVTAPPVTVTPPPVTVTETTTVTAPPVTTTVTVTPTPTASSPAPTTTTTSPPPTSPSSTTTPTVTATTSPTPAAARWLSGAGTDLSNTGVATGPFAAWRGEPLGVGGAWDDTYDAQQAMWSVKEGAWATWTGPLDLAVGAIYKTRGETWAAAATGAYNARWLAALNTLKTKWGTRNPGNLYLRFAHEGNGGTWQQEWHVTPAEAANFRNAIARFSSLRYQVFGTVNPPKLVWCANDGTGTGMADPRTLFVKNDSLARNVVDVYAADTYNTWPHRSDPAAIAAAMTATNAGVPVGIEAHRQYAQSVGVPFAVPEWGSCSLASLCEGGGGDSPAYVQAMNDWFRAHAGDPAAPAAGQVLYENYFDLWDQYQLHPTTRQPNTAARYQALVWGQ